MDKMRNIDFHMHSTVSDGSDSPAELLSKVREAGVDMFALTDHDSIDGCAAVREALCEGDPRFINGVEFSCKDELGKYHILGYAYDPSSPSINKVVDTAHDYRMVKAKQRAELVVSQFGFELPQEEIDAFLALPNPGKPHLGNLLVKYGYCKNKDQAISEYLNKIRVPSRYVTPQEAIEGILGAGGVPVLAHPVYGSGSQMITGEEMDGRLRRLTDFGLMGVEAYYYDFTSDMVSMMLSLAKRYGLYVTAGSDYHGTNKVNRIGQHPLAGSPEGHSALEAFVGRVFS